VPDFSSKDDAWFAEWTARWDAMQDAYVPHRREVFALIAGVLAERFPKACRVADLGAGAGTLAETILKAVPGATVLCLDVEPFLLEACRRRLRPFGDRAKVVRCDLRKDDFTTEITEGTEPEGLDLRKEGSLAELAKHAEGKYEAVVSSTTTHWFAQERLQTIYRWAASMLAGDGMIMIFDHVPPDDAGLARLALDLAEAERACQFQKTRAFTWHDFWDALDAELESLPGATPGETVAAPRPTAARVWGTQDGPEAGHPLAVHEKLLRAAGFRRTAVLWRHLTDALLIAQR
jgi:hypothetical protein